MSKFIEKLKHLSQVASEPMGFRRHEPPPTKPRIQLMASLGMEKLGHLGEAVDGADAVLLAVARGNQDVSSLAKKAETVADIPWGIWLKGGQASVPELIQAGGDFVVFPATQTSLTAVANTGVGKILEVEVSLSEGLLRTVNELPIDAVLVDGGLKEGVSLTWQHLMLFQRFATLLTKPLLVPVPSSVGAEEIQALWKAGVDCLVVEIDETSQGRVKELRQIIDGLPFPTSRQQKVEPVLPRIGHEPNHVTAEEEEEDDDEE